MECAFQVPLLVRKRPQDVARWWSQRRSDSSKHGACCPIDVTRRSLHRSSRKICPRPVKVSMQQDAFVVSRHVGRSVLQVDVRRNYDGSGLIVRGRPADQSAHQWTTVNKRHGKARNLLLEPIEHAAVIINALFTSHFVDGDSLRELSHKSSPRLYSSDVWYRDVLGGKLMRY